MNNPPEDPPAGQPTLARRVTDLEERLTVERLNAGIKKLEMSRESRTRFWTTVVLGPVLIMLLSNFFAQQSEQRWQLILTSELQVKQVSERFSGVPERALIAERLISRMVEDSLAAEIKEIVVTFYTKGVSANSTAPGQLEDVQALTRAAERVGGSASQQILDKIRRPVYGIVASRVSRFGLPAAVYRAPNGLFSVVVGPFAAEEAHGIREDLLRQQRVVGLDSWVPRVGSWIPRLELAAETNEHRPHQVPAHPPRRRLPGSHAHGDAGPRQSPRPRRCSPSRRACSAPSRYPSSSGW